MVPDATKTSLGLEYFCKRDDEIWNIADAELIKLAACELKAIGLIDDLSKVVDGCVFRVANAYPVYDEGYAAAVDIIRTFLHRFKNLRTVGRNGLHRYNNQDHSMLAGRFATMELLLGEQTNLWGINTEQDYHELKMVPGGAAPRTQSAPNLA
jgi:protoporphyrinogen oxidase